jgi:hypothetical protein
VEDYLPERGKGGRGAAYREVFGFTTGNRLFAECLKHSAKPGKHLTTCLPSVTLCKEISTNCTLATTSLSSTFYRSLGTRQRKVVITAVGTGDGAFAECSR